LKSVDTTAIISRFAWSVHGGIAMGKRPHDLSILREKINQQRNTVEALKRDGHECADAERELRRMQAALEAGEKNSPGQPNRPSPFWSEAQLRNLMARILGRARFSDRSGWTERSSASWPSDTSGKIWNRSHARRPRCLARVRQMRERIPALHARISASRRKRLRRLLRVPPLRCAERLRCATGTLPRYGAIEDRREPVVPRTLITRPTCDSTYYRPTLEGPMDRFVHTENLLHLRKQLAQATDETKRRQIQRLLDEEEAKYRRPTEAWPQAGLIKTHTVVVALAIPASVSGVRRPAHA